MAVIYAEDWSAGDSLFTSISPYNRPTDGTDPLYPYIRGAELVKIVAGRLDHDPAAGGVFETYQQAGVWIKGAGALTGGGSGIYSGSGFWDGTVGCVTCIYHPTTASLAEAGLGGVHAPLIVIANPNAGIRLAVDAALDDQFLTVYHVNNGSHAYSVDVIGASMPVAGESYTVRLGWRCGTYNEDTGIPAADGVVRVWINDELMYEATNISLVLADATIPGNRIDSVLFGYYGLLGPQSSFTINDSTCPPVSPLVFKSGVTERPLIWMEHTLRTA